MSNLGDVAHNATFYTACNAAHFVGCVALLNSLRLTGHDGELIVVDAGLNTRQKQVLAEHCRVVDGDARIKNPVLYKPFAATLGLTGIVVLIDSDVIVTDRLAPFLTPAAGGAICAVADPDEFFHPEWEELFELDQPPIRAPYVCAACVSLDVSRWSRFMSRWWDLTRSIDHTLTVGFGRPRAEPLAEGDQSALNALLMSEVDRAKVTVVPQSRAPISAMQCADVEIVDEVSLDCRYRGERTVLLHHSGDKPWASPFAEENAYSRLLRRTLFSSDVPLRLRPSDAPFWLRPGSASATATRGVRFAAPIVRPLGRFARKLLHREVV